MLGEGLAFEVCGVSVGVAAYFNGEVVGADEVGKMDKLALRGG